MQIWRPEEIRGLISLSWRQVLEVRRPFAMSGKERLLSILMSHLCADHNTYLSASIFLISPLAGASRTTPPFTQNAVDVKGFVPRLAWCSPSLPASLLAPGYSRWRSGCREGSLAPLKTRIRDPFRRPGSWQQFRPSPPSTGILGLESHPLSPPALKRNEVTTHLHFYTRQAGGVPRDFIYMMILPGKIKPTASSWWSLFAPTHPEMGTSFGEKNEAFYNTQQSCQRYFDVSFIAQPVFRSVLFFTANLEHCGKCHRK